MDEVRLAVFNAAIVDESTSKNILLLTYWYPPSVGAAAERLRSFAAYLPEHGWNVHVICADRGNAASDVQDEPTTVIRVADPMAKDGPIFADYDPRQAGAPAWKRMLKRFVFPDRFLRWKKQAAIEAAGLCQRVKFDVVLASFPPASAVLLALDVQPLANAALVLDFRDRWIGPGGYEPESDRILKKHRALEREAVRKAAAVIAVSENMADAIAEENGIDRKRVHVVPNGYEPIADWDAASNADDESNAADAREPERAFTIAHVGTVIPRNRPDLFFESLSASKKDPRLAHVRFRFVGNLSRDYIASIGLSGVIESTGLVDRDAARREMRDADALLLLVGDYVGRWGHNAKLFEYVQAGRPMLCLEESPDSNDGRLLKQFVGDRTFFATLGDAPAMAAAIERLTDYLARRPAAAIDLRSEFRAYSRRELANTLATILADFS